MVATGQSSQRRLPRLSTAAVAVFVVLAGAALIAFGLTRRVEGNNERRLLNERAAEAAALLQNSISGSAASLSILASVATLPEPGPFEQSARPLLRNPGNSVAAVAERDGALAVTGAVGASPLQLGQALSGPRATLAARALSQPQQQAVAELFREGNATKLAFAVASPPPARVAVFLESTLDPTRPLPRPPGSPFSEVRAALYASERPDPDRLILTTEGRPLLDGETTHVPFPAGADRWTLVVGARGALAGNLAGNAAWILLGVGLVAAVLASAVVQTLARRQSFAAAMVDVRTRELETTRQFLERLLMSGPTVVLRGEVSPTGTRVSYVSPNVERIFGLAPEEILEAGTIMGRIHPDDVVAAQAQIARINEGVGDSELFEFRLRHGDGSYRWVSTISVPDPSGDATGRLVYLTDITKRREAEQLLRDAQQAAEAANRSKSVFLSRMSHELRTPMNSVLGFGQLLEIEPLTDSQRESVEQILKAGRHLLDLINEVLDIARIESGRLLLSPEPVLVSELVEESLDLVRPLADRREVQLIADGTGTDERYVYADRQRSKQVLLNILSNAIKYNRYRGTVAVSWTDAGPTRLRLSVADTGPGIRPEQMDRLFAPFDRLDAGQTGVEGTGIGLALSKHLAEAMNCTLTAESTAGKGTTLTFELPRVEGPVERHERNRSAVAEPVAPSAVNGRRQKVLYIEDNLSNLKLIERILARRDDVEVVSAIQGRLGVELARQHQPTLVLLDLHLPDVNGEEILRRLREDPVTSSIPVVIVTADATAGQVQRLMSAGATAYLTKPIDVSQLIRLLDQALTA